MDLFFYFISTSFYNARNIKNAVVFESEINKLTYDMEIENIYIIGDFSLKTSGDFKKLSRNAIRYSGDFVISEPKKAISVKNIEQQGYPFFSGEVTLIKELFLDSIEPYVLKFLQKKSNVVSISINGKELPHIMWRPYKIDITEYLKDGINIIEVTLVNSLRNMLGPHHCENGELYEVRPVSFFKEKSIWGDNGGNFME